MADQEEEELVDDVPYRDLPDVPLLSLLCDEEPHVQIIQTPRNGAVWPQFVATLVAALGALSGGFVIGFSSPTIPQMQETTPPILTEEQASWYSSIITLGAASGGPIAGVLADKLGRKTTIMTSTVPATMGWVILAWSNDYLWLYAARFLSGMALGMACLSIPTYIAEVATKDYRGLLGSGFQLSITIGVLLVYVLGMPLNWKWLSICGSCITAMLAALMLLVPETPRWFISHEQPQKARQSLWWLRRDPVEVEEEYRLLTYPVNNGQSSGVSMGEFLRPQLYRPLIISVGLMFTQQLTGINDVLFNSNSILSASFSDPKVASLAADGVAVVQVVFTFLACIFSDRFGRRFLLLFSGTVMLISSVTMGMYYFLTENMGYSVTGLSWLSVASLMLYVAAFSLGWGPIPWLIMSEIFPNNARSKAGSIATALNYMSSFVITKEFSSMQHLLHPYGAFWLFAGIMLVGLIFTAIMLPETKGKTLDEIQENFAPKRDDYLGFSHTD